MKTLNFSKTSWHYWIAKFGCGGDDYHVATNLCAYCWQVLWGSILLTWFTAIGLFFAYCMFAEPAAYLYALLQTGIWVKPDPVLIIGISFWIVIITTAIAVLVHGKIQEYKSKRREAAYNRKFDGVEHKDSFIVAIWRKIHDKTCAKLEFK